MNIQHIITLLAAIANLVLGIFVLNKDFKNKVNRSFFWLSLINSTWGLANFLYLTFPNSLYFIFLTRIIWGIAALIPMEMVIFCFYFFKIKTSSFKKFLIHLPGIFFLLISPFGLIVDKSTIINIKTGGAYFEPGIFYLPMFAYAVAYLCWMAHLLFKHYRKTKGIEKAQIQYIMFGFISFTFFAVLFDIILPLLKFNDLNNLDSTLTLLFVTFIAYAIIKYRLFDIWIIIRRGLIFTLLLLSVMTIYGTTVFLISPLFVNAGLSPLLTSFLAAFILTITLKPLESFFTLITDKIFFKRKYDFEKTLLYLSREIPTLLNFDQIMKLVSSTLIETIKVKSVALFILDETRGGFRGLLGNKEIFLNFDNAFIKSLIKNKDFIVKDELEIELFRNDKKDLEKEKIIKILNDYGMFLVLPLIVKQRATGFLALGEKFSGDPFYRQDLNLLSNLSSQVSISIENSRLYKDLTLERDNLNSIIRGFTDALVVCDDKKNIIFLNPAAEKVFDLKLDESKEVKRESLEFPYLNKIFEAIEIGQEKVSLKNKDGGDEDFQLSKVPLKQESGNFNYLIILHRIN